MGSRAFVGNRSFLGVLAYLLAVLVVLTTTACSDSDHDSSSAAGPEATISSGAPAASSTTAAYSITVGGAGVVAYKYSIDGGAFGAAIPVATPISGTLADGEHTLRIIGRDSGGNWRATSGATSFTWSISTTGYTFARTIGGSWTTASQGQLKGGYGIAVDASGNSYVADAENCRVQKFDADGDFITAWGSQGSGDTNLNYPRGITLDDTYVYVADASNYRVVKYDYNGTYQTQWSTGDGMTEGFPTSIAQHGGIIYVTRRGASNAVTGYNTNGAVVYGPRATANPYAVGTDGVYVYVGCDTGRIYRLPMDLSSSTELYDSNSDGGYTPEGIGPDGSGNLYVSFSDHTIRKIDSTGTRVATFGTGWSTTPGSFSSPKGIAVSSASLYVAEYSRAQKLSLAGASLLIYACLSDNDGYLNGPQHLSVDSDGNVYVSERNNHRIQKFASDGSFLSKWGGQGTADGCFNAPCGLALDADGNVYVSEYQNDRIQKFDSSGNFLGKWGSSGAGDGQLDEPRGLAVNGDRLLVMDAGNDRAQIFSLTGEFIGKWGGYGTGNGQLNEPYGVALDGAGNAYVVDTENHRVQKFSALGVYLMQWGSSGVGDGQFSFPFDIARDHGGNLYVADHNNDRVLKFSSDGTQLAVVVTSGSGAGEVNDPTGVWVDARGNLYVAEEGNNNRVQVFSPQ